MEKKLQTGKGPHSPIWKTHDEPPLTRDALEALCAFEIPCIRIVGFATDGECGDLVAAMDKIGLHKTYKVPGLANPPRYVGLAQFEKRKARKEDYFAEVEQAWNEYDAVLDQISWNPFERMWSIIRDLYPENTVTLAEEPGFGRYYAGIIRDTSGGGTLHADVTMYSARSYAISAVINQLSWNLFCSEVVGEGGKTTLHNRPYRVDEKTQHEIEIEGFDRSYVEGAQTHEYAPVKGDVVLFNSHNPHEWTAIENGGRRMGVSTYIGRLPDGNFIYWS
ncbi:MAG: hypothetical protein VYA17_12690 [Pseudomonadota bacterium]|nr:hypothetical protein [Pseudomonadota bacterium]